MSFLNAGSTGSPRICRFPEQILPSISILYQTQGPSYQDDDQKVCACMSVCIFTYACACVHTRVYACLCVCVCAPCMCVPASLCVCAHMCVCAYRPVMEAEG